MKSKEKRKNFRRKGRETTKGEEERKNSRKGENIKKRKRKNERVS